MNINDNIDFKKCNTMRELIESVVSEYKEKAVVRFIYKDEMIDISYNRLLMDSENFAKAIFAKGIQGKHIAIVGENSYEWLIAYFGASFSDNVVLPLDPNLSAEEAKDQLDRADVDILIFSNIKTKLFWELKDLGKELEHAFIMDTSIIDDNIEVDEDLAKAKVESLGAAVRENKDKPKVIIDIDPDKLAYIVYTSGTTGISKGVMLSQRNIVRNSTFATTWGYDHIVLSILPLHHSFGLTASALLSITSGWTYCINDSVVHLVRNIKAYQPTYVMFVPVIVERLYYKIMALSKKIPTKEAVVAVLGNNTKHIISGGAYLNQQYIDSFNEMGIEVYQGYGLTECSPAVAQNNPGKYKPYALGAPITDVEVTIEDGEIVVGGPGVMLGYYNMPEETAKILRNGKIYTGDLGYIEDDFVFLTGRKKNLIILSNGENVSPELIENPISESPLIKELLAYGKDGKIVLEVVPNTEMIEALKVEDHEKEINDFVSNYNSKADMNKMVSSVIYRDEDFPKTSANKIIRKQNNNI